MFNDFIRTYSYGIWEFLKPRALVEGIHACIRVLADSLSNVESVNNVDYNPNGNACIGITVGLSVDSIEEYTGVSGYSYLVKGLPENLVLIGKSPDSKSFGVTFEDFIPYKGGYLFKKSPSIFGTTSNQGGDVIVSFYIVGGPVESRHQPQFKVLYDKTANSAVYNSVKQAVTKGLLCNGISSSVVKESAGITTASGSGIINKSWKEGDIVYSITDNDLLKCPQSLSPDPVTGIEINAGDTIETKQEIVIYRENGKWYFVDDKYPSTSSESSESSESSDSSNSSDFPQLFNQKVQEASEDNIVTINATYGDLSVGDYKLLHRYLPQSTSLHIVKRVVVNLTDPKDKLTGTSATLSDVNTFYVFYTNSSDIPNRQHEPDATSAALLRTHYTNSGCWRVDSCTKGNGYIYGVTSNSTIFGNVPGPSSKIYGIAAVIGGNTYKDDVVYSYCNIEPVSVGSGVEAVIVGLAS